MNKLQAIKITEENTEAILAEYNIYYKDVRRYAHQPLGCYIVGLSGDQNMWRVYDEKEFRLIFMLNDIESDDEFTEVVYQ